ncbi:hypothetical protein LY90DRAFT_498878 [Neocallimastix californiae]|uniref:Right handed beta helix domain-containing protein n=1 Tax=Neocallimastix californiae TaxID=1754190 RepID=A0A1Y2FP69_9FUNG|nr:hypothetical protein LY90DRAFT_498878 [Neocallimastix californiae]|eukprot:ORY85781.1 hypothetical protein LY90DRAFT_498878 [Neocallimastix californiae]
MIYIIRGGGVLKAEESYVDIKNSTFSNSFSRDRGGIFFIDNCPSLDIDSIEVRNTTSTSSGYVIYINQDTEHNVEKSIIQNVYHVGSGNKNIKSVFEEGFIACVDNYATLSINNYYGQDFYGKNLSGGTFVVKHLATLYLNNIELDNIYGIGVNTLSLFLTVYFISENGPKIYIENCQVSNMENASEKPAAILIWQEKSEIHIKNIISQADGSLDINNFVVDNYFSLNVVPFIYSFSASHNSGFRSLTYSTIEITSSRFENMYFNNGLISDFENNFATYNIYSSVFSNINGVNGGILNIKTDDVISNRIAFIHSIFTNNSASNYGGIVYSTNPNISRTIFFIECTFINNTASIGSISYSLNKLSEPFFSNKNSIMKENSFATNPSYIKFTNDSLTSISVYSGEEFPGKIACSIFDDYDNIINIPDNNLNDLSTLKLENFVFFSLYQNGTNNGQIVGLANCYYWNNECSISNIKRTYKVFSKNSINIEVEIKNCNETGFINKDLYNFNIKSW